MTVKKSKDDNNDKVDLSTPINSLKSGISINRLRIFPKIYNQNEFCKDFFVELPFARVMIRNILDAEILNELNIDKMTIANPTMVTNFLRMLYSDIVYRIPLKKMPELITYLIVEFKSDNRSSSVAQLYEYSHNLWIRPSDREQGYLEQDNAISPNQDINLDDQNLSQLQFYKRIPFPCVIAAIFHCGESKYTGPTNVADLVNLPPNSILRKRVINFNCDIYDLNVIPDSELPKESQAYMFCRTSQILHLKNVNEEAFALFEKMKEKLHVNKKLWITWDKCLYHLYTSSKHFSRETYNQLINLTKELGVKVMSPSVAEKYYEEAMTIGLAKGKAEGFARGVAKSIIRILRNRLDDEPSVELQGRIMGIKSMDKLDELLEFAFNCVSLGEFETALN
jgi:hypothetical protein